MMLPWLPICPVHAAASDLPRESGAHETGGAIEEHRGVGWIIGKRGSGVGRADGGAAIERAGVTVD